MAFLATTAESVEMVKIDPKSIGVGQYQHDVNQQALKQSLDDVVTSCVNTVDVQVNTASEQLLTCKGRQTSQDSPLVEFAEDACGRQVALIILAAFDDLLSYLRVPPNP